MPHGVLLGIDFGTFNTVAMVRRGEGDPRPLLFDGSPLLPSAVLLEGPGDVLAGADAVRSARLHPESYEPNPKRRMSDGIVLLGGHEVDVVDLVAAVLGRVAVEARQVTGQVPDRVVVTHPEIWGTSRLTRLTDAVARAGLPQPKLVSEPVAAAAYFLGQESRVGPDQCAVVYDFGAGTFDAGVVRRRPDGALTVLASEGLPEVGGLDLDAALVEHLGQIIAGRDRRAWERLRRPESVADRRARWQLWEDVRLAKESLSRRAQTLVHLPFLDESVPVSREEFEQLAEPVIARTVAVTRAAVRSAGIGPADVGGVFLVGGSSRVPLVATLLHRALGTPPTVLEQPELVVAEGSLSLLEVREERTPAGVTNILPVAPPPERPARATVPPPVARAAPNVNVLRGPRKPRPAVLDHLADPWGAVAAAVLGILAGVVASTAGAGIGAAAGAGVGVALLVYVVRVGLGLVFERGRDLPEN